MKLPYYIFILIFLFFVSCKNIFNKGKITKETEKISQKNIVIKSDTLHYYQKKDILIRNKNEIASSFINRLYKKIDLNHPIIETEKWINDTNIIFIFINDKLNYDVEFNVEGYIYVSKDKIHYKKYSIDTYAPEGRNANVESVFFANVDNDKNKELIIICSWNQRLNEIAEGKIYETFIYDDYNIKAMKDSKLIYLNKISDHFGIGFEGVQDGKIIKAKYKTEKDIKKELKILGF